MSGPARRLRGCKPPQSWKERPDMRDGRCRFGGCADRDGPRWWPASRAGDRSVVGCSPATVKTPRDRWLAASDERGGGFLCLFRGGRSRSLVRGRLLPSRSRRSWTPESEQLGADAFGWRDGPASIDELEGAQRPAWRAAAPRRAPDVQALRMDRGRRVAAYRRAAVPKFDRPGHWATGQRAEEHKTRNAGKTVVIGVIDDHTRLAYCELHARRTGPRSRPRCSAPPRWFESRAAARSRRS